VRATKGTESQNWLENAIKSSYLVMKEQFNVKTHSDAVKKITNLGFNSFVLDADIRFIKEMEGDYFPDFTKNFLSNLDVTEEVRAQVKRYMESVPFSDIN
jgi:hypothetical protein